MEVASGSGSRVIFFFHFRCTLYSIQVVRIRVFDGLDYNWAFGQVSFTIVNQQFSHFALAFQALYR